MKNKTETVLKTNEGLAKTDNEPSADIEVQSHQLLIGKDDYILIQKFRGIEIPSNYKGGKVIISWNDLMPVVQKIYNWGVENHNGAYLIDEWRRISDLTVFVNIEALYGRVVEFIKWYNQQTK